MKPLCKAIVLILAVGATRLLAYPYSVDKNGNGTETDLLFYPPTVSPLPFEVASDPTGGITNSPVLIYSLGWPVASGDLALMKPDGTIGDLLRFFTPSGGGNSFLIFYSQTNISEGALADVGIPYTTNPVEISEVVPKTHWVPVLFSSQPGSPMAELLYDFFTYTIIVQSRPVSFSGTNLIWTLADGPTNLQFRVLATTNLALPLTNWPCVFTNQFNQSGSCVLTLPMEPDKPRRFYGLSY